MEHRALLLPDGQHGRLIEKVGEVGVVGETHQFDFQAVKLADAFVQFERDDIKLNCLVGRRTEGKAHIIQIAHANSCGSSHRAGYGARRIAKRAAVSALKTIARNPFRVVEVS